MNFAPFCPPASGDLEAWLLARMPPGAAKVPVFCGLPQLRDPQIRLPRPVRTSPDRTEFFARTDWLRMEAAYMFGIERKAHDEIAAYLGCKSEVLNHRTGRQRSRTVERYLSAGGGLLRDLGAWPWAVLEDAEDPRPPSDWHQQPRFATALAEWHRAYLDAASRQHGRQGARLRHASTLHQARTR